MYILNQEVKMEFFLLFLALGDPKYEVWEQSYTTHHPNVGTLLALRKSTTGEDLYVKDIPQSLVFSKPEDTAGPMGSCHRL